MSAKKQDQRPVRVLISGFGPFPGVPVNPAEPLVESLKSRFSSHNGIALSTVTLDTSFHASYTALRSAIEKTTPDIVIAFGLRANGHAFNPESTARNRLARRKDAHGIALPAGEIIPGAPPTIRSTLPLAPIRAALAKAALPVRVSKSAGTYVCNNLFYRLMTDLHGESPRRMAGFVHIPYSAELARTAEKPLKGAPLPQDLLVEGAAIIIETAAREWRRLNPEPQP